MGSQIQPAAQIAGSTSTAAPASASATAVTAPGVGPIPVSGGSDRAGQDRSVRVENVELAVGSQALNALTVQVGMLPEALAPNTDLFRADASLRLRLPDGLIVGASFGGYTGRFGEMDQMSNPQGAPQQIYDPLAGSKYDGFTGALTVYSASTPLGSGRWSVFGREIGIVGGCTFIAGQQSICSGGTRSTYDLVSLNINRQWSLNLKAPFLSKDNTLPFSREQRTTEYPSRYRHQHGLTLAFVYSPYGVSRRVAPSPWQDLLSSGLGVVDKGLGWAGAVDAMQLDATNVRDNFLGSRPSAQTLVGIQSAQSSLGDITNAYAGARILGGPRLLPKLLWGGVELAQFGYATGSLVAYQRLSPEGQFADKDARTGALMFPGAAIQPLLSLKEFLFRRYGGEHESTIRWSSGVPQALVGGIASALVGGMCRDGGLILGQGLAANTALVGPDPAWLGVTNNKAGALVYQGYNFCTTMLSGVFGPLTFDGVGTIANYYLNPKQQGASPTTTTGGSRGQLSVAGTISPDGFMATATFTQ